jgi:hypothetical protein
LNHVIARAADLRSEDSRAKTIELRQSSCGHRQPLRIRIIETKQRIPAPAIRRAAPLMDFDLLLQEEAQIANPNQPSNLHWRV